VEVGGGGSGGGGGGGMKVSWAMGLEVRGTRSSHNQALWRCIHLSCGTKGVGNLFDTSKIVGVHGLRLEIVIYKGKKR